MRMSKLWHRRTLKKTAAWALTAVMMCGATLSSYATAAEAALFEGMWKIEADADAPAERGGRLDFTEYFIIESGVVTASELSKLGFEPATATYSTDAYGNTMWTVSMTSRTQGTLTINGAKTSGNTMTGTLQWDREGGSFRYAYSGRPFTPDAAAE
jgi:hypothetical protein